jgi:AcrR family transcriptional regulator
MSTEPNRRERILSAAERLFQHYGPGKTTMADIARECGIAVGSVYLDFSSKEEILSELAGKRAQTVAERMRAAKAPTSAERLVRMLEARVEALFDLAREGQHACDLVRSGCFGKEGRSAASSRGGPEPRASKTPANGNGGSPTLAFGEEPRAVLEEELRRGVEGGELAIDNVAEVRETIELAFTVLAPPHVYLLERKVATRVATRIGTLVVFGLVKR